MTIKGLGFHFMSSTNIRPPMLASLSEVRPKMNLVKSPCKASCCDWMKSVENVTRNQDIKVPGLSYSY
ncbi:MAG: hypothetical protein ACPIOQ_05830, partial [Promethearchaeia archaeon]